MNRTVIGIDPGLSGAVAFVPDSGAARVVDMPTAPYSKTGFVKRALDLEALARLLEPYAGSARVYLERVSAFPGQGVGSMFSLGMSYWGAAGAAVAAGLPVTLVEPKAWKAYFGLTKDKGEALTLARRLFPGAELHLAKHHNRAEALLIAAYGAERP